MAGSLVPCPSCARHVRASEQACPFCRSALPAGLGARAVPNTTQRLSRAAVFTFAASLAATGCASDPVPNDTGVVTDTGSDSGSVVTDRGPSTDQQAPADTGTVADAGAPADNGVAEDAGTPPDDSGAPGPLYGLPAFDAGQDASIGVRYGSPPRPDADA